MAAAFVLHPMIYRHCRLLSSPGAHPSLLLSTKSLISSPSPLQNLTRIAAAASGLIGGAAGDDRLSGGQKDPESVHEIKAQLFKALEGVNRGIFGVTSAKKTEIEGLIKLLESQNPTPFPTDDLTKVEGCWKLIYSTITILGAKRTKLGLRELITLGEFFQIIDVNKGKAINTIEFNARGFKLISGQLTIEASYQIASRTRVNIKLENSSITPDQLRSLFEKSYDLLLAIFNPQGWLEITYVDESLRTGRDDKGNIFVLQRT